MNKKEISDFIKLKWKIFLVIGIILILILIILLFSFLKEDIKRTTGSAEISNENLKDNSFNSKTNYTQTTTSNDSNKPQGFRVVSISENIYYTPDSGNTSNQTYNIIYFTAPTNTDPAQDTNPPSDWGQGGTDDSSSTSGSVPGMPTLSIRWKKIFNIF